jgi:hypothetical protein
MGFKPHVMVRGVHSLILEVGKLMETDRYFKWKA